MIIGGEVVVKDRKHLIFDAGEVFEVCEEPQRAILSEAGLAMEMRWERRWVIR